MKVGSSSTGTVNHSYKHDKKLRAQKTLRSARGGQPQEQGAAYQFHGDVLLLPAAQHHTHLLCMCGHLPHREEVQIRGPEAMGVSPAELLLLPPLKSMEAPEKCREAAGLQDKSHE